MSPQQQSDPFDLAFTALCELYGKTPSPAFYMMYRDSLVSELGETAAVEAIRHAFKQKTYGFPKPGDLIDIMRGDQESKAFVGWEQLQEAVRRAGAYQSVLFEDPRIARVIKILGGWEIVCSWPMDQLHFRRLEFIQAYKGLDSDGDREVLSGIHDRINAAMGYQEVSSLIRIGGPKNESAMEIEGCAG